MTSKEIHEAYAINPYGAILEVEKAVEQLREAVKNNDEEALENAVSFFDETVPELKTTISARYGGDTKWIPFNTTSAGPDSIWVLEYDSENAQRIRRRKVSEEHVPEATTETK